MRGSEKKIIYIKDTGSKLFEEAYFVLRRGVSEGTEAADDMVQEAARILEEGSGGYPATARRSRRSRAAALFFAGAAAAVSFLGAAAFLLSCL